VKLAISTGLSFLISIERELHSHPGGACTHILVGLGSCLFTMISVNIQETFNSPNADPARICAQIVSGMGFLGSATIFKSNNYVKGINTAANLWISAAISMAIGANLWELGLITALFTLIVLIINNRYKRNRYGKQKKRR
jgi:putative Mg2+ transporter-C (MgtC) family protein